MSDLKINNITDRTGGSGPVIAGVSTVSTTGSFVVPVGATEFRGGRGRGIFSGGRDAPASPTAVNNIDYITIASTGNSLDFGDLTRTKQACSSTASATRSVIFGGYISPTYYTDIDYITISSGGGASHFGDLVHDRGWSAACGDGIRGLVAGSWPGPTAIEFVNIATTGDSSIFGDLSVRANGNLSPTGNQQVDGGCSSPTRGIWGGGAFGVPSTTAVNLIQFVNIQTLGNSIKFGELTRLAYGTTASSNNTRGIFYGGRTPTIGDVIDYITIATEGNATDFGNLTGDRIDCSAVASSTRGVVAGGVSPSNHNNIEYVTIATTGNAVDFGDLTRSHSQIAGSSDVHGGLG